MKNKALTYALLIVVAIIWYQVFFRVKNNLMGEDAVLPETSMLQTKLSPIARDTFDLKVNYRDPFGEGRSRPVTHTTDESHAPVINRNVRPVIKESWPSIQYFGLVRKTESKTPLAILKVDGLQLMIRKGEELYNDFYVNQIWRDSIQIKHKRDLKTYSRI